MKSDTDNQEPLILSWNWQSSFTNIVIRDGKTIVGTIKDFREKTVNHIYGSSITLERQGLAGQHIYFNDPTDNKAYCKYEFDKITSPDRDRIIIDNILCEIVKGKYKSEYKKIAELKAEKTFFGNFKDAGELIIYHKEHIGIDIFSLFYNLLYQQE
ncbi:MAG: hypothetical protein V4506_18695 [Bacteroidota bacterium]